VEVVDHDDDRRLELREAVEELQDEARRRARARRRDPAERRAARNDTLDGCQPLRPERGLAEPAPRREPGDLPRLGGKPRCEQRRLARSGGRRDQRERSARPLVEPIEQTASDDEWAGRRGDDEVRGRDGSRPLAASCPRRQDYSFSWWGTSP
jgi:hypothetical protein